MFDSDAFLQATITQSVDTTRTPVPPGDYTVQINTDEKAISVDKGTIGKGDRAGQPWASLVVLMTIPDPSGSIKAATGRDPAIVRHNIFLDFALDGSLDFSTGKNIQFAKLFEACGWPVDDKKRLTTGFGPQWLRGKTLKVKLINEPNPNDASQMFERITAVTKA